MCSYCVVIYTDYAELLSLAMQTSLLRLQSFTVLWALHLSLAQHCALSLSP